MRFLWNNLLDDEDNVLTSSSDTANYEQEKVIDPRLAATWRTTSDTTEWIVFDAGMGNTFTVDSCIVAGHNLTSGATIKFQMHTADSWGTPDLDETLTWRDGTILKYFTQTSKRYIRFYFDDGSNTDEFISIGRLSAGEYLQITPSSIGKFKISNKRTDKVKDSISNQMYSDIGYGYREFDYKFPSTQYDMIDSLRTVWDTVGSHKPFFFSNFDTRYTEIEPAYVRISSRSFDEQWTGHLYISYKLRLRETA